MSKKQLGIFVSFAIYTLITTFNLIILLDCSDKPTKSVLFADITVTDEFGNVLSWDPSDWCVPGPRPLLSGVTAEPQSPLGLPTAYYMYPAYPNPTKDSVTILYALPTDSKVKLWIINRYGQDIITLTNEFETAGYKSVVWHLQDSNFRRVGSDIYRAIIEAGQFRCNGDIKVE